MSYVPPKWRCPLCTGSHVRYLPNHGEDYDCDRGWYLCLSCEHKWHRPKRASLLELLNPSNLKPDTGMQVLFEPHMGSYAARKAATAKMWTTWVAGRDPDRRVIVMQHVPERRWRIRVLSD